MGTESRGRQGSVWAVGLGYAVLVGLFEAGRIGAGDALVWAGFLALAFAVGYGANRLQVRLARPPVAPWRGALLGLPAFLPMFLVWFPASDWAFGVARAHHYRVGPSVAALLFPMFWGLLAPGGIYAAVLRRLRGQSP